MLQIPIYAHVKALTDPQTGRRTALEVNYCKFLAYNGSYKLFGWIYIGEVGCRRPSYLFRGFMVAHESLIRRSALNLLLFMKIGPGTARFSRQNVRESGLESNCHDSYDVHSIES